MMLLLNIKVKTLNTLNHLLNNVGAKMSTVIKLKRSSVPGHIPTTISIELSELCINTYDGKIYFKKDNDDILKVLSTQDIDTDSTFTANSDDIIPSQKAVNTALTTITTNLNKLIEVHEVTSEPTGFVDRTDSDITFDDLTRTFSITTVSGYEYYIHGAKYTIATDKSIVVPNVDGSYFFFLDSLETLSYVTVFNTDLLRDYVFIASVNWSTTQSKILGLAEERHGITMDWATHSYLHTYVGARIRSTDFAIGHFVLSGNGSDDAQCQASIGNGTLTDEDINSVITHSATPTLPFEQILSPTAELPIMHKIGSDTWYLDDATTDLVKVGTSRIQYNLFSGTWSAVDVTKQPKFNVEFMHRITPQHWLMLPHIVIQRSIA